MFKQVIVVEGTHDEAKIKEIYSDIECVITNGSEISTSTLNLIKELSKTREIIIFTDPDFPGERIRNRVLEVVPSALHAFIKKDKCISSNKKKVGVEHATKEDIKEALDRILEPGNTKSDVKMIDLINLGLAGTKSSSHLRDLVSERLNIGKPNAKTFLNRLNMFGINLLDLKEIVGEVNGKNR